MNVHFLSKTIEWETPQSIFDSLNKEFRLKVDVCATTANAKLSVFFTKKEDGLAQDWKNKRCWMNPPYGKEITDWIQKAATGGGYNRCGAVACAYRYALVSRIYIWAKERGSAFLERTIEIWGFKKQCAISFYGSHLAMI